MPDDFNPCLYARTITRRPPTLKRGDTSWWVKLLYRELVFHKCLTPYTSGIPEAFDIRISDAVDRFIRDRKLKPTTTVGSLLWSHLAIENPSNPGQAILRYGLQLAYDGVGEQGGNNRGRWVRNFTGGHEGPQWAWCVGAATYIARTTLSDFGIKPPIGATAGTGDSLSSSGLWRIAKERGLTTTNPQTGDYAILVGGSTGHKHTALYSHRDNQYVYVVEGNVRPRKWLPGQLDVLRIGRYPLSTPIDYVMSYKRKANG